MKHETFLYLLAIYACLDCYTHHATGPLSRLSNSTEEEGRLLKSCIHSYISDDTQKQPSRQDRPNPSYAVETKYDPEKSHQTISQKHGNPLFG